MRKTFALAIAATVGLLGVAGTSLGAAAAESAPAASLDQVRPDALARLKAGDVQPVGIYVAVGPGYRYGHRRHYCSWHPCGYGYRHSYYRGGYYGRSHYRGGRHWGGGHRGGHWGGGHRGGHGGGGHHGGHGGGHHGGHGRH